MNARLLPSVETATQPTDRFRVSSRHHNGDPPHVTRHQQSGRTLQQQRTAMSAPDVLVHARDFFARRSGIYAAFLEKQGPNWMSLRGQGGEEIAIAATEEAGSTTVSASSYMFDAQVAQFLSSLPPADDSTGAVA
jgi:hypothetical protein